MIFSFENTAFIFVIFVAFPNKYSFMIYERFFNESKLNFNV